jgi:hypothetical protein
MSMLTPMGSQGLSSQVLNTKASSIEVDGSCAMAARSVWLRQRRQRMRGDVMAFVMAARLQADKFLQRLESLGSGQKCLDRTACSERVSCERYRPRQGRMQMYLFCVSKILRQALCRLGKAYPSSTQFHRLPHAKICSLRAEKQHRSECG